MIRGMLPVPPRPHQHGWMRRLILAAACSLVAGACSLAAGAPESSTTSPAATSLPPPATTTTAPPTTTTLPSVPVDLTLHDFERLATRGGIAISVEIDGEVAGALADDAPTLTVFLTEPAEALLTYLDPEGRPADVAWTQTIDPAAPDVTIVQPWRDLGGTPDRHVLAWQSQGDTTEYLDRLAAAPEVTVTSPLWWSIDAEGELGGAGDAAYVAASHERGVAVWPAVQGIDADGLHLLLTDVEKRRAMAQALADAAAEVGADGLNIDVEGFRDEDAEVFSEFVEEIAAAVHEWGGVVSYDLVPKSDRWDVTPVELAFWSTAPQRRRLAAAVDYTVLMAYDQHNRFRPAGPVASPIWVEELIVYALRYADPHRVMLGIPAYGRIWDPNALDAPRALAIGSMAQREGIRTPDPQFGVDRVDLADGRFYWAEQDIVADRLAFVAEYGLSGWAVWRLGLDDRSLWDALP